MEVFRGFMTSCSRAAKVSFGDRRKRKYHLSLSLFPPQFTMTSTPRKRRIPMRSAVIIDAIRTPIGRAHAEKGMYRDVRADDLSADLMKALLERVKLPGSAIEDVQWGCVKQEK